MVSTYQKGLFPHPEMIKSLASFSDFVSNTRMNSTLLPSGLFDLLPPHAARESALVGALLQHFRACGYEQVHPPLMEYEDSLLSAADAGMTTRTFRVMDPLSQRMMAIRADMTMQVARIAGTLLKAEPRPLRLCYGGQTLRTTPEPLQTNRQFRQIGLELIGAETIAADIEVMQTAAAAVMAVGLNDVSIDLSMPPLLHDLAPGLEPGRWDALSEALHRKDRAALAAFQVPHLAEIATLSGPAEDVLAALHAMPLHEGLRAHVNQLEQACALLRTRLGERVSLTLDPLDAPGFDYYTGVRFSLFLKNRQREIGRGGRYRSIFGETATGFTLYSEDLLPFITTSNAMPRLLLPPETSEATAARLRAEGYATLYATSDDLQAEAARLGCRVAKH